MTALRPRPGRIVPRVRLLFDASLRDRCSERSCCLGLRGISRHVVLRGESVAPGRKMCDCIVLHDAAVPRIVFVELKSGLFHIGQVLEKFTNALDWLSGAEESIFGKGDYRVTLPLLHKRRISKTYHSTLRNHRFRLGGRKHSLRVLRCGEQLATLYERMGPR